MSGDEREPGASAAAPADDDRPIRVLLLDDLEDNLILRSTILRQKGYEVVVSSSVEEARTKLEDIDIAVLDYHLGEGKFGTVVAEELRRQRPNVPIIILSATLERKFGGVADMHLLKGYSSVNDLLAALARFEGKRRGKPVVVDAREFYYSRIGMALGEDFVIEVLDAAGNWQYVNEYFARLMNQKRQWFVGQNLFATYPEVGDELREIVGTVAATRETYIDRKFRGADHLPTDSAYWDWNVLVFPIKLHDGRDGVVLTARLMEKKG
jgi:CheY-like chemotaxis protein